MDVHDDAWSFMNWAIMTDLMGQGTRISPSN
jgi:hypothetical protein